MRQRMNEIIRDKSDNGGPIQFLDRASEVERRPLSEEAEALWRPQTGF